MLEPATLGRAFVIATVLWALVLPLAPLAVAQGASAHAWSAFAIGAYAVGSLICHQLSQRSFHLWSVPLPVCARCTGIYAGAAVAAVVARMRSHPVAAGLWRRALIVAAMPTAATLGYEWTTAQTPANWIRASAGVPLGAVVALIVVSACAGGASRDKLSEVN